MELVFAKVDKTLDSSGWILDHDFLKKIHEKVSALPITALHTDMECIEAVLLISHGEEELLKQRLKEILGY